jgi:hypothetical protein
MNSSVYLIPESSDNQLDIQLNSYNKFSIEARLFSKLEGKLQLE